MPEQSPQSTNMKSTQPDQDGRDTRNRPCLCEVSVDCRGRHQGVNLDFQRRSMSNFPTRKCEVISGKCVCCGRPASRKGNSSPGVMKPGTNEPESVLPAQRNVLNERKDTPGRYTGGSIYPSSVFHWQRSNFQVSVCIPCSIAHALVF